MSKKLYLSTLETLPEGVKITRIFGNVSAKGIFEAFRSLSSEPISDRYLVERCAKKFPEANAILGITHTAFNGGTSLSEYYQQGTAVEISGHDPDADFICAK